MLSLGLSTAVRCGRTECVPPRRPPSASSPGLPRKAISPPPRPPRRGGLRTPAMTPLASPRHVPARPPARRLSRGHHDIPRACVRPVFTGAETAPLRGNHLRAIPGPSSARPSHPRMVLPRRGGLRTPAITPLASPRHVPARPPARRLSRGHHDIPRACVRPVFTRRGDRAPPRKPPQRHLRPPPGRPSCPGRPSPRRGGLRTPARDAYVIRGPSELGSPLSPQRHGAGFRSPPPLCYAPARIGLAYGGIHGRGDRAPPRKPPPRHPRAFPARPFQLGSAHPAEGRALHAHNDGIGLAGACPHLATRYSFASDDHVMPRLASGLTTRTHGMRPSEKTALHVISGLSPRGHPSSDHQSGGGAGSARP
jgi:hypothetical protein